MKYLSLPLIIAIVILAWCPWFKADEALSLVDAKVVQLKTAKPNLCPMFIYKDSISKVPFGYTEKVSYDCTITGSIFGVEKSYNIVFITFYKEIIGMPSKTVVKYP